MKHTPLLLAALLTLPACVAPVESDDAADSPAPAAERICSAALALSKCRGPLPLATCPDPHVRALCGGARR